MNTSLSWIKAYVPDLDVTAQEYADAMTLSGTKVEGYEKLDADLDKIVIGRIEKIEKHPDADKLVTPVYPLETDTDIEKMKELFRYDNFKDNYKVLNQEVRKFGINVPPLVNAYMSLSPKMRVFGTAINHEFGDVEETGILIAINEILEDKKKRHIETYLKEEGQTADLIRKAE